MNARIRCGFLLVPVILITLNVSGQNLPNLGRTSVHGSVHDVVSHAALQHVIVTLENQNAGYAGQAETDGLGKFIFQGIDPSQYILRVRHPGYEEVSQSIDLTVTSSNYINFELRALPRAKTPAVAPEGPAARLNVQGAAIPDEARNEFTAARQLFFDGKNLQSSIDHLQKAIKIYPPFADAYALLGMAYIEDNKLVEAKSALVKAIEIDPKLADPYFTLGMMLNHE